MQRATRELPTSGYALVVDGHMKAQFETREGARKGAEDLEAPISDAADQGVRRRG